MSIVRRVPTAPEIQTILNAWSKTLQLDGRSGESIVTELDLNRLARILCQYVESTLGANDNSSSNPLIDHSITTVAQGVRNEST